ncbi:MAG: hypothetical protein J7455_09165 [Roseiflexus sp.]|jgi:hypothetical protein|nr:hypothetical protein [Roseiflexus sp.]MBO9341077.1 hypothetical protein [Roseiflexus sp.]MBO9365102.1 hypothetical protein [Roseiflexus sp.]MBO9381522.1 hypothetical protein [Roseiflexus sp.]MBO9389212.1 hypothetical protein [Roseiflexus sp.]
MVSIIPASLLNRTIVATRRRLRDWFLHGADKQGTKHDYQQRTFAVTTCFTPLIRWVVALRHANTRWLVLAMDASTRC